MRPTPDNIDIEVGKKLKEIRLLRGLTQEKVATLIGVTMQQIQKYERGKNRISASRIYNLARALEVNINDFFAINQDDENNGKQSLPIDEEGARVLKSYREIKNPKLRASLQEFIKSLSERAA